LNGVSSKARLFGLSPLPPDGPARDREVLRLFSAKEAIYKKALDPWVQRFVV
jgi:4'-phosphopantetheinyl transferase EntD